MSRIATRAERVIGVYVVVTDVTQHKLAERAIAESEARFRAIANSAPVLIWVTGADGRREFVNQAYLDFFGGDLRRGARVRLAQGPPSRRPAAHPCARQPTSIPRQLGRGRSPLPARTTGEWRWLRAESQPRWTVSTAAWRLIGVAHDITAAKQARQALASLNETP